MKCTRLLLLTGLSLLSILYGCATFLPSGKAVVRTPWNTYQEITNAYNKVVPNETTVSQLRKLGFDLYSTPNVKILNYLDIASATQSIRNEDLSPGLRRCIKASNNCRGYEFEPNVMKNERIGNFWLDIFNFKRKTKGTGWQFKATFLVIEDIVVDKYWSGNPNILQESETKNPLGPFQDVGGLVMRLVP